MKNNLKFLLLYLITAFGFYLLCYPILQETVYATKRDKFVLKRHQQSSSYTYNLLTDYLRADLNNYEDTAKLISDAVNNWGMYDSTNLFHAYSLVSTDSGTYAFWPRYDGYNFYATKYKVKAKHYTMVPVECFEPTVYTVVPKKISIYLLHFYSPATVDRFVTQHNTYFLYGL